MSRRTVERDFDDVPVFQTRDEVVAEIRHETFTAAGLKGGTQCPTCDQHAQVYRREITPAMVRALGQIMHAGKPGRGNQYVHAPTVVVPHCGDTAKLAYWGLIAGDGIGVWRCTAAGNAFLNGWQRVQRYATTYRGRLICLEGELVDVHECNGRPFSLAELLGVAA